MDESLYHQFYEVEQQHWWFVARQDILLRYIEAVLRLPSGARVLDVGCGTGAVLEAISKRYVAHGIDFSPLAVEYCKKRGLKNVFSGTLSTVPANDRFDLLTYLDVIEHIDDDFGVLRDGWSLLKPGGSILITVPAYQWLWSRHDELNQHKRRYTASALTDLVLKAGYRVRRTTYFNTILFPLAAARRLWGRIVDGHSDDLALPSPPVNTALREIFRIEKYILSLISFPFGVSILCHAVRPEEKE